MNRVSVHEAKTNLSRLLAKLVQDRHVITICRNGVPVADLVPHRPHKRSRTHPVLRKILIGYDPTETLSAEEWPEALR